MHPIEESILTVADIVCDSAAMGNAILSGDYDEARFRAQMVVSKADAAGHQDVVIAAVFVLDRLGPPGGVPRAGFSAGMLRVAEALDAIEYERP